MRPSIMSVYMCILKWKERETEREREREIVSEWKIYSVVYLGTGYRQTDRHISIMEKRHTHTHNLYTIRVRVKEIDRVIVSESDSLKHIEIKRKYVAYLVIGYR